MDYNELMQKIKSAFATAPVPEDDHIICHECEECFALRDGVRGQTPDELSDSWVEKNFDQLPLFSDDAKRFYFPAYFRFAALKPDSLVAQFVLYSLSEDFRMQPSGGYSAQQRQVIRDFLEYIETRVDELDKEDVAKAKALWQSVA
jgi:hypothetical protein